MQQWIKVLLIVALVLFVVGVVAVCLGRILWAGWFTDNNPKPKEIATYNSPDGKYTLVFEQMGDPQWPFGSADVRLTVKDSDGNCIAQASSYVANDGGHAHKGNIVSIQWGKDEVTVTLDAEEMKAKEVVLSFS